MRQNEGNAGFLPLRFVFEQGVHKLFSHFASRGIAPGF
jgi:hypothetical protein